MGLSPISVMDDIGLSLISSMGVMRAESIVLSDVAFNFY
jgi:hypothetical protein